MSQHCRLPHTRPDGLQLEEHRDHQERLWNLERWAWAAFGGLIFAALLGATGGGGLLAHRMTEVWGGVIEYPRIGRWQAGDVIVFHLPGGAVEREVAMGTAFAEAYEIRDLQPPAERVESGPDGQLMYFRLDQGGPARIVLHVRPEHPGLVRWRVGIDGGPPVSLSAFILP